MSFGRVKHQNTLYSRELYKSGPQINCFCRAHHYATNFGNTSKLHVYQSKTELLRKNIKPLPENEQSQSHCGHTFSTTQPFRKF